MRGLATCLLASPLFALAACASAVGPHDNVDLSHVDAGVGDSKISPFIEDLSGPAAPDLAHTSTGVSPTGTWKALPTPADGITGTIDSRMPDLTIYEGQPTLVWVEGKDLRVASYDGTVWQARGAAFNPTPGTATIVPKIEARNDKLAVAFLQQLSGEIGNVWAWNGTAFAAVGGTVPLGLTYLPKISLSLSSTGTPYVTWNAQSNGMLNDKSWIFVKRFDGSSWVAQGAGFSAEGATSNAISSQIVLDETDKVYVTWQEKFVHVYDNSTTWTPVGAMSGQVSVGTQGSWEQELAIDHQGHPVVAWEETATSSTGIFAARYSGSAWTPLTTGAITGPAGMTGGVLSDIAVDGVDAPLVSWTFTDATHEIAFVARIANNTYQLLGQPISLPATFQTISPPTLVVDPFDVPYLVFSAQQKSDMTGRLFVYRYEP
jgi:hypothetical protein